ncbi:MAG: hypothetical protein M3542_09035 [Acidobacteriota bacterium]|nr:hypothetical protein [Acidobacteriota bacterium]
MKTFVMFLAVAIGAVAAIAASQDAAATATSPPAPTVAAEKSEITSVYGTVTEYEPGRSITVAQPDRKSATYAIDRASDLPGQLASGRRVVVHTITRPGLDKPLVRKVTIKKAR